MKKVFKIRLIILLMVLLFNLKGFGQNRKQEPNIIVFLVDDMGWEDTSVPFWDSVTSSNKKFHTPNMERLSNMGMKFTNAYATSLCTPTRVSLMTGMNEARTRVTNFTNPSFRGRTTDPPDSVFREVAWNVNGLSPYPGVDKTVYATPLPAILREAGYYTIQAGKGHFGPPGTPGSEPRNLGFNVAIGGHGAGSPQSYLGENNYGNIPGHTTARAVPDLEEYYGSDTFLSEALTKEAIKAIQVPLAYRQPFFLYMAHYAVHAPYNVDKRFVQRYLDAGYSQSEAAYCALIEGMDHSLGQVIDFLEQRQLMQNTIIIFMSDNGGFSHPPRGGKSNSQNYPLRGGKGSLYEGGIREPMIVYWPKVIKAGSICNQYVAIQDFFPTILQMAGIKRYKAIQEVDGRSIIPYVRNPDLADSNRILTWNFPNKWGKGLAGDGHSYVTAIRQGSWKLVYFEKYGRLELYNLAEDIKEQHDLAKKYPQKAAVLARLLTQRLKKYKAQRPIYKSTGNPVPWPDQIIK